jgi:hypothetical protein
MPLSEKCKIYYRKRKNGKNATRFTTANTRFTTANGEFSQDLLPQTQDLLLQTQDSLPQTQDLLPQAQDLLPQRFVSRYFSTHSHRTKLLN